MEAALEEGKSTQKTFYRNMMRAIRARGLKIEDTQDPRY